MNRVESVKHLMKAAKVDESRMLQQSICYYNIKNWSLSVSWGYSVQIYEEIIPPSILQKPLETFTEWLKGGWPPFMFNYRPISKNHSCEVPHVLFFDKINEEMNITNHVITSYKKILSPRIPLPDCSSNNINNSAKNISKILVLSHKGRLLTGVNYMNQWKTKKKKNLIFFFFLKCLNLVDLLCRLEIEENVVMLCSLWEWIL